MSVLLSKYRRASRAEARLRFLAAEAAAERTEALAGMHDSGMSYGQIAKATSLSRSRVQQLVERGIRIGAASRNGVAGDGYQD